MVVSDLDFLDSYFDRSLAEAYTHEILAHGYVLTQSDKTYLLWFYHRTEDKIKRMLDYALRRK